MLCGASLVTFAREAPRDGVQRPTGDNVRHMSVPPRFAVEHHKSNRIAWLRAAVLGANDGIVSVAGLTIGVAAASASRSAVVTAGIAGLIAGAMSMATGEFVSVSSQRDAERADEAIEAEALRENPRGERRELAKIYEARGVEPGLARLVAEQLMAHDELGAHMRDELGITEGATARPLQAAWTSALAFTSGALLPLLAITLTPTSSRIAVCAAVALVALVALGALGAYTGGAPWRPAVTRVVVWSSLAMLLTYGIGRLVGASVS
jgi:VIT1/CCC1 family predicted Fe2+/Mn2+ transporter